MNNISTSTQTIADEILADNQHSYLDLLEVITDVLYKPSVAIWVDGHGKVTGFIACSIGGRMLFAGKQIGERKDSNYSSDCFRDLTFKISNLTVDKKLLESQNKNISSWLTIMCFLFLAALLFCAYLLHLNSKSIAKETALQESFQSITFQKPLNNIEYE